MHYTLINETKFLILGGIMNLSKSNIFNLKNYIKVANTDLNDQLLVDELIDLASSVQSIEIQKIINFARKNDFFGMKPIFKYYGKRFLSYEYENSELKNLDADEDEKRKLEVFFNSFIELGDKLLDEDIYEEEIQSILLNYTRKESNAISRLFIPESKVFCGEYDTGTERFIPNFKKQEAEQTQNLAA